MDLIKITAGTIGTETAQTVNARDLYAFLGVRKDFSDWVKVQINRAHLIENEDYAAFPQKGEQEYQGVKTRVDYALTLEAGKHIAMMAGTPKGRQVRAYFIECERRLRTTPVAIPARGLSEEDKKLLFGTVTTIVRREFSQAVTKVENTLTAQNRHLWKAITGGRNALALKDVGFVEVGAVYRLAGLAPSGHPSQAKLSGNISRALDAWCKRHGCLVKSAQVGSREVTHWPENAVVAWLSEAGHQLIRDHMARFGSGKVQNLRVV